MTFNLGLIVIGLLFLVYSIHTKNKLNYYNSYRVKELRNKEGFYSLQWKFALLNVIVLIGVGIYAHIFAPPFRYVVLVVIVFHGINYVPIIIGKRLGYIK